MIASTTRVRAGIDWLVDYLRTSGGFSYDFETLMLPFWHKDWQALSIAFSTDGSSAYVVPLAHRESRLSIDDQRYFVEQLTPVMVDPKVPKVAHNQLFDALCWFRLSGQLPHTTIDSMVLAHLLDENRPKGLKYLGRAILGLPQWDVDARKEHSLAKLSVYNGIDAAATWQLQRELLKQLKAQPRLWDYYRRLEAPKLRALERLIARGVHVDATTLHERILYATEQRALVAAQLPLEKPASTKQVAAWLYGTVPTVNGTTPTRLDTLPVPTSPSHPPGATVLSAGSPAGYAASTPANSEITVLLALKSPVDVPSTVGALGLKPPKLTPAGQPSTDEETIQFLALKNPEVRKLLEWRRWNKYLTTYFEPLTERLATSFDGRIHPEYRSTSVETGRLASGFHTIPRESLVRSVYTAPSGTLFISADFSQVEARLAAWAAAGKISQPDQIQPGTMLHAWYTGRDVYREQAAEVLAKPLDQISKDDRQLMGKVPVLAMLYRISPKGLKEYAWKKFELDWTLAFAGHVHASFYRRWPEFSLWHEREARLVSARGYAESAIGRMRRLPAAQMDAERNYLQVHEAQNSGINHPIQHLATSLNDTAMILLDAIGYAIVGSVHDNLLIEVPTQEVVRSVGVIARVMENSHYALRPLGLHLPPGLIGCEIMAGAWGAGKKVYESKPAGV